MVIRLDPLSETESRRLLSQRIARGPGVDALEQVLVGRTGGNPLFLQEILSSLAEEGVLRRVGRRYRLVRAMEPPNLPGSVRSLLSERIDRLGSAEKDVLQAASVIGQSTTLRLLERVARSPATADICARLQSAGFFEPVDAPEPTYVFHHGLMCEAAYAGLLHQRREVMHARVVDAIEELHGDRIAEHVETLAGHAARARHWRKAVEYARRAGQKTASRDANVEFGPVPRTRPRLPAALGRRAGTARHGDRPSSRHPRSAVPPRPDHRDRRSSAAGRDTVTADG